MGCGQSASVGGTAIRLFGTKLKSSSFRQERRLAHLSLQVFLHHPSNFPRSKMRVQYSLDPQTGGIRRERTLRYGHCSSTYGEEQQAPEISGA
jgi:hypothetical protein